MERVALSIVWTILAYLLGSVPVGLLLARLKGKDPRGVGSGNIGATNVMRAAGKTMGVVTLVGDVLKGFLPTWLAGLLGLAVPVVGLAAFLGHLFPVYLRFKGGKGSA
ncbi:MAG: glycerol-3-phosphate acyltransferase, partial [Syntrophorhabdales bacterium]